MTDITIASARKPLNVNLVGVDYVMTPPKAALAIEMAADIKKAGTKKNPTEVMDTLYEWLAMCMSPEDLEGIKARLLDPNDDLDIPQVTELLSAVMAFITKNPPTSPSGS